jgi:archaellum biogenesis ATPase FlaH
LSTPTPAPSSNFFDDPNFLDRLVHLLCTDLTALKQTSPVLKSQDFEPLYGNRWGHQRWVVAERALEHYRKHREPLGLLLRAEVLAYAHSLKLPANKVKEFEDYLKHLAKVPLTAPEAVVSRIVEYKRERIRASIIQEMSELQASGQMTNEKWAELVALGSFANTNGHTPIDYYRTYEDRAEYRALQGNAPGSHAPAFFIDPLDQVVKGIGKGSLGMVLAPRKRGKSLMLAWMAMAFSFQRLNTLMITLEDPVAELQARMDAAYSSVPIEHLATSPNIFKKNFKRYISKHDLQSRLQIVDGTGARVTVPMLEAWVQEYRDAGFMADVLIVDYDAYIHNARGNREQKGYEGIEQVYADLVGLAGRQKMILWTAAQTKAGTETLKILGENHVAGWVGKLNYAHQVLSIGKGDWGDDSFYLWCGYHKFAARNVGCHVVPDMSRMAFYSSDKTRQAEKQYGTATDYQEEGEEDL